MIPLLPHHCAILYQRRKNRRICGARKPYSKSFLSPKVKLHKCSSNFSEFEFRSCFWNRTNETIVKYDKIRYWRCTDYILKITVFTIMIKRLLENEPCFLVELPTLLENWSHFKPNTPYYFTFSYAYSNND